MERLIQLLDDLDDLISAIGLARERIRNMSFALSFVCIALIVQVSGILLALSHPPLALAIALLMFVTLLYRSVTTFQQSASQASLAALAPQALK